MMGWILVFTILLLSIWTDLCNGECKENKKQNQDLPQKITPQVEDISQCCKFTANQNEHESLLHCVHEALSHHNKRLDARIYTSRESHTDVELSPSSQIRGHNVDSSVGDKKVRGTVVSYYSTNIIEYSAYAFAVNAAWAQRQGLRYLLLNATMGHNWEPLDARWNRVRALLHLMQQEHDLTVEHRQCNKQFADSTINLQADCVDIADERSSFYLWLDADLIVLDDAFDPAELLLQHPAADLLVGAERHAETGIANTGSLLLRNTAWARAFLDDWWEGRGLHSSPGAAAAPTHANHHRSRSNAPNVTEGWARAHHAFAHDQYFFDRLYGALAAGTHATAATADVSKIAILPTRAMNSVPPAYLHQLPSDKILHLMGEHAELRKQAFRRAWLEGCICTRRTDGSDPSLHADAANAAASSDKLQCLLQRGLSRPVLVDLTIKHLHHEIHVHLQTLLRTQGQVVGRGQKGTAESAEQSAVCMAAIAEGLLAASQLRQLTLQLAPLEPAPSQRRHRQELSQQVLQWAVACIAPHAENAIPVKLDRQQLVHMLNLCATVGHDLLQEPTSTAAEQPRSHSTQHDTTATHWNDLYNITHSCLLRLKAEVDSASAEVVTEMHAMLLQVRTCARYI